jgi:hypothetical protein
MAINYKVLGQIHPAGTADTNLYTVPAATQAIVSTMTITNVTASPANARVFARIAGAATAHVNAILYDAPIAGNTTVAFTLGLTLAATDIVTVKTSVGATLTFQLFGSEIS